MQIGCKLGAKFTQFAPNFAEFLAPNHPVSLLECMAGTTGLEPATSAVTVFNDLQTRGERLRPPKSWKTALFVDRIVDQVSQPSYASSSVSALLRWQQLSQAWRRWDQAVDLDPAP